MHKYLGVLACLLTICGAKDWLIAVAGSATPFWDQWDAEAVGLYKPFLDGTLPWSQFFANHNEHRILFTRMLSLGLLWLNQYWDPLLEMAADAVLHVLAIAVILLLMLRAVDERRSLLFCLFVALVYAVPFGWENTLMGFAAHFYLLVMFSGISLWCLHRSTAWRPTWWLGMACAVASYFNMASGAMTVAAGIGLAAGQMALGRRRGWGEMSALGAQAAVLVVLLAAVPSIPQNAAFRAHSLGQFFAAFFVTASWPFASVPIFFALLIYAPALLVIALTVRHPPAKEDHRWFVVGMALWMALQLAVVVYGRASIGMLAPRYRDILLIGPILNFLCLLVALDANAMRRSMALRTFAAAWLILVVTAAGNLAVRQLPAEVAEKQRQNAAETKNLTEFLANGDIGVLEHKPIFEIPYPSAERLAKVASLPGIRAILPPMLPGEAPPPPRGMKLRRTVAVFVRNFRDWSLRDGRLLLPIGLALFFVAGTLGPTPRRVAAGIEPS